MTMKRLLIVTFTIFAISSTGLLASTSTSTSTATSTGTSIGTLNAKPTQARPVIGRVAVGGPVSYQVGWGFWGGYGPYWGGYGPYWGPWGGPWGPYGGYYGGYYYYYGGSMQIQVKPKEAEVYVDGYRAGVVNDYDSWYQSLNLEPGGHEIVLYLEGYRTQRHQVFFTQGSSQHIKGTMEKLAAGESSGPRPQPSPRTSSSNDQRPRGPRGPRPERAPSDQSVQVAQSDPSAAPQADRFGTLSIKVQPADATILVDNHTWQTVGSDQRMSIQLAPGRHHVEVSKDGFASYVEDVLIRTNATMTLNVGLTRK